MEDSLEAALQNRVDLDRYSDNKRLLFALQLTFSIEDIDTIAATALTDSPNDKSCDLIYIDRSLSRVILAQGYESKSQKSQAPGRKAASLHQAVNWLLNKDEPKGVPQSWLGAWKELHEALDEDAISNVEIWYVHNLPESTSIADEIDKARDAARLLLQQNYPKSEIEVTSVEIGEETLSWRYQSSKTPILVTDRFRIEIPGAFEEQGATWTALCTSVPTSWIREVFARYRADLFSSNVREYLGSRRSKDNINNGIQETVKEEPANLWAYNNGITALVHDYQFDNDSLEISGLSIVNGAQTTGAIGSVPTEEIGSDSRVLVRFIRCDDDATVRKIVRFNNRQNPTKASDFRSNDGIQRRLVQEFSELHVVGYSGGRRGGAEDIIRRPGENFLSADSAAQSLAAFHGESGVAYHQKSRIWEQDSIYSRVFPEGISARHIVFVASLLRAVEIEKNELGQISAGSRTQDQKDLFDWFSLRGSIMLCVEAVGFTCESILDSVVSDPYTLHFKQNLTVADATRAWKPVIEPLLAFAPGQLQTPLTTSSPLRNRELVKKSLANFRSQVVATRRYIQEPFKEFSKNVSI